jgi:hypothetical protein
LFPTAGEAVIVFQSTGADKRPGRGDGGSPVPAEEIAARRAVTHVRRYSAANLLSRLGTLTYAGTGCHDPVGLRGDVRGFFRALRARVGSNFPYLWTAEWHPGGHGLHVHFAVGRYLARGAIERAWPHGFVHIKLLGDLPYGVSTRGEARHVARYLSKYVAKSMDGSTPGLHRYDVAEGFAPPEERASSRSSELAVAGVVERMGRSPDFRSDSPEWTAYAGPPAVFVSWD